MSRIDDILAKQKALAEELDLAKQEERDVVLKDIKEKIKMFDFKATDFKGMFKSRVTQKQVDELSNAVLDMTDDIALECVTQLENNLKEIK